MKEENIISLKYHSSDFEGDLKESIEEVERAYKEYLQQKDESLKYFYLKMAIYDLSLTIKHLLVEGRITHQEAEELKNYYWGLLC